MTPAVRELASGRAGVALLWEMCQIPDYRKISAASHAELVATLYRFVMSDAGKIPADWFARQVALADRTDGDLDTLSNRLAQIRTWTFVSHRAQWLDDPEHWQGRTRAIEDMLSDALHERLTHRFVDRRTSVLMRRLRDKEELVAEIGADGSILVENHYVGRLDGFRFTPDASERRHSRPRRAPRRGSRCWRSELAARAAALAAAPRRSHRAQAERPHRLARSRRSPGSSAATAPLKPKIQLLADEHLGATEREQVLRRIEAWLARRAQRASSRRSWRLSEASDLSGLARGLAFRLAETLGVLRRDAVVRARSRRSTKAPARSFANTACASAPSTSTSRRCSSPPPPISCCCCGRSMPVANYGIDADALPPRPQQGLTSVEADASIPEPYWHAAGFQVAGARAIRIDMLERLSDLIRARVSWQAGRGRRARAVRRHRRRRLSRGARADERGRLLGRGFRLDLEGARLPARAAEARAGGGAAVEPAPDGNGSKCRLRTNGRRNSAETSPSTRSGVQASARTRGKPTRHQARSANRAGGARGKRKRRASASRRPRT